MWIFLSTLAVMGTVVYLVERMVKLGLFDPNRGSEKVVPGDDSGDMPEDLVRTGSAYAEEWARTDALARYFELRQQLGSWDAVRVALGKG